jgi:RimJ/RimL family protein N-acetyltransferase
MQLRFEPVTVADTQALSRFLAGSEWPFHQQASVDDSWVRGRMESGHFLGENAESFWVRGEGAEPWGFVRAFDLGDLTPLVDLRIAAGMRGRGVGTLALRGLSSWVFSEYPNTSRLGGCTRFDNLAMCRVFEKCGFTKEAHHRRAWPVDGRDPVDCVGYAILRSEFEMPNAG